MKYFRFLLLLKKIKFSEFAKNVIFEGFQFWSKNLRADENPHFDLCLLVVRDLSFVNNGLLITEPKILPAAGGEK